ncbi:glycosyltransferase family 4 protein [Caulobacter sp. NIBR2454]|uniref:glycosyltransferase family 4 protein n=1 Tax=Caulobacter sp. NIBR2454 TaxID=3015996 RepID=UPI0022B71E56|nr:glycosyltransferase family 4 protein [Caulobacter sp. NIBR2454]
MRIAMLAPISWRTPPRQYGPWELATSLLTEGLVARGIDVTLFATGDSLTAGKLEWVVPRAYSEAPVDVKVAETLHVANVFERAGDFDIIHNQADFVPLAFSRLTPTPMVTTIHGFSSEAIVEVYARYDDAGAYVSISDANRHSALNYAATVHHGIKLDDFPFDAEGTDDLLFFGRIHPDKGAAEAVELARRTNRRMTMAGIIQDQGYFDRDVAPGIDGDRVRFIGAVGGAERARILGKARALLHLINFDEPFGLSVVEAMACGTPVIAMNRGSMPELIDHGVTGFLVESLDEAADALTRIHTIDRIACRAAVEARFTVERMVDGYLEVYRNLLAPSGRGLNSRLTASA